MHSVEKNAEVSAWITIILSNNILRANNDPEN
jgi:hypothetical protein